MLGITSVQKTSLSLDQQFLAMKAAGFDAIMLWWGSHGGDTRERLVNIARASGLYIENVHAPTEDLNVLWEDDPAGDARLNDLAEQIADCEKLGMYADRLFALHLHDNEADRDAHMIPFDGSIVWQEKAKKLPDTTVSLRWKVNSIQAVYTSLTVLTAIWKRLSPEQRKLEK